MLKRLFLVSILFFVGHAIFSQPFGNEWIQYNQSYYRFKVWNDGMYRISYSSIVQAIPELTSIDPRNIQIFNKGQEQAIYIQGENDGTWDNADFIEFFGRKNTGWFDTSLYPNSIDQSNSHYSLFSDTAAYYITWNNSISNLRMVSETDVNFTGLTAAPYFINQIINQQTSDYYFGETDYNNSTDPEYTDGEGWSGPVFSAPL
jgi:hypothetical protein